MHARLPFVTGLLLLLAAPAPAQETDEQMAQTFQRQRDAFRAAEANPLGLTRQLKLITVDDLATNPDLAPAVATPSEPPAAAENPRPDEAAVADAQAATTAQGEGTTTGPAEPAGSPATTIIATGSPPAADGAAPASEALVFGRLVPELQVNVRITFPFDSATLTDDQIPKLAQICRVMRSSGTGVFRIVGHTDAAGTDLYNERLSLLRAQEVRRYFIDACQFPAERLEAVGLGERILFDAADPRGPENRRVEFQAIS